ncbi:hypothetical protein PI125_g26109 [Phytophthora idaei]|nr:hypothetical protein PI125_g26109 [Phytophthora idaei]
MPTDYESDISDVPMEDGEVLSSAADSESAAVALEPVTGSRRTREDGPTARVMMKKRGHQRRLLLLLRVLYLQNAFRGCQECIRDCFQVRCDFATEPDPAVRVQRSTLIR